ncbi:DNA and RNA helicase [Paenibacillus taichungensis]|uniref:DNA and RNA helicase n=1 Tax=Paenibacillus taichungensis TaxID=484184 RepID=A0A329QS76_9BACL|nr:DNA and RNA helicase [Paenibacillus taichungensis]RAW15250.1 DNA and RNA helicase [Paenibacillus taichungensis]
MLVHIVPRFEKGRILRTEMLENLRDFPRNFLDVRFEDYSDGILTGLKVSVEDQVLIVGKGVLKHAGRLYLLEDDFSVPYMATGRVAVLKMIFLEPTRRPDFTAHHAEIVLEGEESLGLDEVELGRFKLKPGAVLRSDYQDFADMNTEFNTWCDLHAPYSAISTPTLRPDILRFFAYEMLQFRSGDVQDHVFSFTCLNSERVSRQVVEQYIYLKTGMNCEDYSNVQLHRQLSMILDESGRNTKTAVPWANGRKGRMIVD